MTQTVATVQRYAPLAIKPSDLDITNEAQVMGYFEYLLAGVPMVDSSGAQFIGRFLGMEDVEDLMGEIQEKLPKAEDVQGRTLKVNDLHRNVSTVADSPLSHYLIVDSTDTDTGEQMLWQTSAGEPTAKLVKIYEAGRLPALVQTRKVTTATKSGYFPVNLIVLALGDKPTAKKS